MTKYGKLVKHKRKPRTVTKAFSKNSSRLVKTNSDGSTVRQSYLSGRTATYSKTGRKLKSK